jgi:hypothetical protein
MNIIKKQITNYPSYEIYSNGRVFSNKSNKFLVTSRGTYGYEIITLYGKNKQKTFRVHRLVGLAFLPKVKNKSEINHKDGNKLNNDVENLEWTSRSENVKHAYDTNLKKGMIQEKNGRAKLTIKKANKIREDYMSKKYTQTYLAKKYKLSQPLVGRVINNLIWNKIYA